MKWLRDGRAMNIEIIATAKIHNSEDANKVVDAIKNVVANAIITIDDGNVIAVSRGRDALRIIHQQAKAREVLGVLKKKLLDNLVDNQTWFYINKQAAYAGVVVICDEAQESPLGPIKIEIRSDEINNVIEWLANKAHQQP